jgi:hypothetical protein
MERAKSAGIPSVNDPKLSDDDRTSGCGDC